MTTTYELYTNENGTPKAVEGKAPAILERVEALETDVGNVETAIEVLEGGVVKTINGETPDQAGNIDIPVGHNVGEEWISYTGKIPNGGVPYCGQTVTRATYADLWSYAQAQGLVKTESEWQSWASSHGGNVPYYSGGNGSTTFRMPKLVGYIKGASSQGEAGQYIAEGLPDHIHYVSRNTDITTQEAGNEDTTDRYLFDTVGNYNGYAEKRTSGVKDNSIYGNSDHVTPETSVVMFGVYAFGEITNQGALDAETLATGLATIEAEVETREKVNAIGDGWIRYESGLQICWGADDIAANSTTLKVTFPVAFASNPAGFMTHYSTTPSYNVGIGKYSTTGMTISRSTSNKYVCRCTWLAVGKWK